MQNSTENANSVSHYKFLVLTVVIGLVGVYLRFVEFPHATLISNLILLVASGLCLKAVFGILK
ncbi:hypothetical protein E2R65_07880 [Mucilaginibacter phyllosphaerae]|uniref:Gliding motility protein GldL n=1 Tax=Mucilaginibacter phyllosphaerae TaxID=1812349 RepID=A0A4Y8AGM4_9SPHI|nr:hypothetical protein [Mucilaginibacter phyllosphaerae]MBB3968457.1 hypothetical protein [Mucilaginibacter phyllosphaerae]TEW67896.1 hypothetical protein E2R65_07880 [Mucilaginibacter phyllosphaerae]GGH15884.1 hypothetical protein GCM10007352_24930 [Mucilaginibacter phyllosphaerae]